MTMDKLPDFLATDPPFARHEHTAELLLRTLEQGLQSQFVEKGAIGREDLARAIELMIRHGAKLTPLFASNCRACVAHSDSAAQRLEAYQADQRRRDYVTRLLFSSVVTQVPESFDPLTGEIFPRVLAGGLQSNIANLFYDKEWEAMNCDAMVVFQKIGTDRDDEVWERVGKDEALPFVTDAVFVRVMLRFRQFAFQRQNFIRRMTDLLRDRRFAFTDDHFVVLFDSMFGRLRDGLTTELGRARVDTRYGDETAGTLLRIFDEFDSYRRDLAKPVKSLAGTQKMMNNRHQAGMSTRLIPGGKGTLAGR